MPNVMKTFVVPVSDLEAATATYRTLLGVDPHVESEYYVGFRAGDLEFGITPNPGGDDQHGAVAYWGVDDIHGAIEDLVATGASVLQEPTEVGGGASVALLADADGNRIGLIT